MLFFGWCLIQRAFLVSSFDCCRNKIERNNSKIISMPSKILYKFSLNVTPESSGMLVAKNTFIVPKASSKVDLFAIRQLKSLNSFAERDTVDDKL